MLPLLLPEMPPPLSAPSRLLFPISHRFCCPRHPVPFSHSSFPPPSPFSFPVPSYLSPPCTLLASELQRASPTNILTIIILNRPPRPQERRERGKKKKKQAEPPPALTPSRLIFSTVAPSSNAGSKWGPAQPGEPLRSAAASREQMPPRLSSPSSLVFVLGGPGCDLFYFHRLFIGIFFSFLFFIFWPGGSSGEAPTACLFPQLCGRQALSLVCALASLLSPLPRLSLLRSSVLSGPSSADCPLLSLLFPPPRLSFLHPSCPFSLFPLPLHLLSVPISSHPFPPPPRTPLLWFPHCH